MNKQRRKELDAVMKDMSDLRMKVGDIFDAIDDRLKEFADPLRDLVEEWGEVRGRLEDIKNEEEEYRDNMPENMQGSDRYQAAETAVDEMGSAYDELDTMITELETMVEDLIPSSERDWYEMDNHIDTIENHIAAAKGDE